jgi:hypothetical protein
MPAFFGRGPQVWPNEIRFAFILLRNMPLAVTKAPLSAGLHRQIVAMLRSPPEFAQERGRRDECRIGWVPAFGGQAAVDARRHHRRLLIELEA